MGPYYPEFAGHLLMLLFAVLVAIIAIVVCATALGALVSDLRNEGIDLDWLPWRKAVPPAVLRDDRLLDTERKAWDDIIAKF